MPTELTKLEAGFDIERMKAHIEKRKQNIVIYEKVIAEERTQIDREIAVLHELELRQQNGGPQ